METIPLPNAQPDTTSRSLSSHAIFKTLGAVITGLVTWFFVATVLNLALRAWWPHYHEAETAFNFTFAMKLARLVLGAISSLGAGFVAAWIGKGPDESGHAHWNRVAWSLHPWSLPDLG